MGLVGEWKLGRRSAFFQLWERGHHGFLISNRQGGRTRLTLTHTHRIEMALKGGAVKRDEGK